MSKLTVWQERFARAEAAYDAQLLRMDEREDLYRGSRKLRPFVEGVPAKANAWHVQNIVAENIESEVDVSIPQPKVTPRRKEDEWRAEIIENMLRGELDRLRMEELNDMQERTVPIQGGGFWLVEWDSSQKRYGTTGEVEISTLHPKQVIPQDGIYSAVEDMDYIIVKLPQTKEYIRRRYGVDVDAGQEDADDRNASMDDARDLLTQYIAYYRGDGGNIGMFSWVNDCVLEDIPDYQARRLCRCGVCGTPRDMEFAGKLQFGGEGAQPQAAPGGEDAAEEEKPDWFGKKGGNAAGVLFPEEACPHCGATQWETGAEAFEEIFVPHVTAHGAVVPGARWVLDGEGALALEPTLIPAYKPGLFPVVLQRNVSVYGQLLGESDVDKIADLQNAVNWMNYKIDTRLMAAGTIITGPAKSSFTMDPEDGRILRLDSPADKALIDTYEFTGDVDYHYTQLSRSYEAARQVLGITDSYQGRADVTATSGKAKEFAAAQSAGRLESKRVMKAAAFAKLFELMFKFRLAYADEPRPVVAKDARGDAKYDRFDRYDFLEQDPETGEWWWNDQFLFSCDATAPLAANREAMWQEARLNFTSGAYGDPTQAATQILFWSEMERLHYPLAAAAKKYIEAQGDKTAEQAEDSAPGSGADISGQFAAEAKAIAQSGDALRSRALELPEMF